MRKFIAALFLLLMMTGAAFAEPIYPEGLELDTPQFTLEVGQSDQILYRFTPENQELKQLTVTFASSDPSIAEVGESTGEVTGVSPGQTTIIVTAEEPDGDAEPLTAACEVTVNEPAPPVEPVDLSKVTMKLKSSTYYKTGNSILPLPTLTYNGKTLVKGTHYTLKYSNYVNVGTATVKATAIEGSGFKGTKSVSYTILPAKPAAAAIKSVKSSKPYVVVTWKKVICTGYQLQVSRNSDFSKATKYSLKATTKKVPKLKNGKKYYFRVRAYNTENGKTTYGIWSKTSSKVKTTGPVGNRYSKDGVYIKDKTIKIDGNYYYYNAAGLKSGCSKKMWTKVRNKSSKTKYLIAVDCTRNRTCIYEGKKGAWKLKSYWKCTTGKKSTPTIKGSFKVCGKVSHFGEQKGYSVWYATRIKYEYYFHSILYKPWSKSAVLSGTLGKNKSHGCVRLKLKNAKWIYKNCKGGTKIVIY